MRKTLAVRTLANHCTQYIQEDAPRYTAGHAINIGAICIAVILIATLLVYNKAENAKRASGERDHRLQEEDEDRLGSRHPNVSLPVFVESCVQLEILTSDAVRSDSVVCWTASTISLSRQNHESC